MNILDKLVSIEGLTAILVGFFIGIILLAVLCSISFNLSALEGFEEDVQNNEDEGNKEDETETKTKSKRFIIFRDSYPENVESELDFIGQTKKFKTAKDLDEPLGFTPKEVYLSPNTTVKIRVEELPALEDPKVTTYTYTNDRLVNDRKPFPPGDSTTAITRNLAMKVKVQAIESIQEAIEK